MFPTVTQRPAGALKKPALNPADSNTSAGLGTPGPGYSLLGTWMTGLGNVAGVQRVDRVDNTTIAVTGELDKKCVIAIKDLKGETLSIINMGNEQVRGLCVVDLHRGTMIVVTKREKIELWDPLSKRLVDTLRIPEFDPCAICPSGWDTVLVADWSQPHPNYKRKLPKTELVELQVTRMKLKKLDHKLTVDLTCVVSILKTHKILAMASFNNDVIMAVSYLTGALFWKISNREFEGMVIRPNGLCSDEHGYIYVADTGLPYCRVFVVSPVGKIVKKVLNTAGWCDDVTWINEDRKLVVLHDKTGLDKQDISIYSVDKLPAPKLAEQLDSI